MVGGVWVVDNFGGRLIPIDPVTGGEPRTGAAIATAPHPRGIAIGFGSVWLSSGDEGTVARYDLNGGGPTATVVVGADPADVDIGGGAVWTADQGADTVSRIDPAG